MKLREVEYLKLIGEVSKELDVPPHVLRFWESKFNLVSPDKRRGRRYYKEKEIDLFREIKELLYNKKYTIEGAKKYLENSLALNENQYNIIINNVIKSLKDIKNKLNQNK